MIALTFYVAIGLSFFAMCFKLMEEEAMNKLRRIGQRMGILKRPEVELLPDPDQLLSPDATIVLTTNAQSKKKKSRSNPHRSILRL